MALKKDCDICGKEIPMDQPHFTPVMVPSEHDWFTKLHMAPTSLSTLTALIGGEGRMLCVRCARHITDQIMNPVRVGGKDQ